MSLLDTFHERRPFPGQDPWIVPHAGELLLVQSAARNRRLVIKRFADLAHIHRNRETVIWPSGRRRLAPDRQVWSPELHHLDGRWYVYFSASNGHPRSHRCYALVADDPLGPYEDLGPVADPDHDVWAIDLTVFEDAGRLYAAWSGWEGTEDGFPQNLYVAPMGNPWTISGERRCISRPEHGWETSVAAVNEGPQALRHPATGRLFLLYSADASWSQAYKMGVLECTGGDVLNPDAWHKQPRPFFTGGGHGSVLDADPGRWLVYHRKRSSEPGWADREILWAPLSWDGAGTPVVRPAVPRTGAAAVLEAAKPPSSFDESFVTEWTWSSPDQAA